MRRVHVVTVGASLLSNALRNWESVKSLISGLTSVELVEERLNSGEVNRNQLHKELVDFLRNEGELASAEIASMSSFLDRNEIDFVYLLYTDTLVGDVCSRALESYLEARNVKVQRLPIEGYSDEETFSREGLGNLATTVWKIIKSHKKNERVYVCATGGFKPETSIITVIANLQGIPVYYRHESFRKHVAIPGLPITWHFELKENYNPPIKELFDNIRIKRDEFYKRFGQDLAEEMQNRYWLIRQVDEYFELTPIGRLMYDIFRGG
jgi:putative CRISPR-associated protein (TIGR02619 family)